MTMFLESFIYIHVNDVGLTTSPIQLSRSVNREEQKIRQSWSFFKNPGCVILNTVINVFEQDSFKYLIQTISERHGAMIFN